MKATKIKDLPTSKTGAIQVLFKMEPPLEGNEFVVVSGVSVPYSGPETYIFPADEEGIIIDFGELDGSFRGAIDINEALRGVGYEVEA